MSAQLILLADIFAMAKTRLADALTAMDRPENMVLLSERSVQHSRPASVAVLSGTSSARDDILNNPSPTIAGLRQYLDRIRGCDDKPNQDCLRPFVCVESILQQVMNHCRTMIFEVLGVCGTQLVS